MYQCAVDCGRPASPYIRLRQRGTQTFLVRMTVYDQYALFHVIDSPKNGQYIEFEMQFTKLKQDKIV